MNLWLWLICSTSKYFSCESRQVGIKVSFASSDSGKNEQHQSANVKTYIKDDGMTAKTDAVKSKV